MRKKIIFILTTVLMVMLLTGCGTVITAEEVEDLKNVASEIKNSEDYKLPEGYTVSYPDKTTTNKIAISCKTSEGFGDNVIAVFDMTKAEPELISYQQNTIGIIWATVIITMFALLILATIFGS